MTSDRLENLVRIGKLKREPPHTDELLGLRRSGLARLADAERSDLSYASRFDLAYNAAHALALYALRRSGYRSDNRYLAFQTLAETAGLEVGHWRVLAKAHERRNLAEYEGYLEPDERLLTDLLAAIRALVEALPDDEPGSEQPPP